MFRPRSDVPLHHAEAPRIENGSNNGNNNDDNNNNSNNNSNNSNSKRTTLTTFHKQPRLYASTLCVSYCV